MLQYTIRKLLAAIPIILAITVIVFVILHMTPGDPIRILNQYRKDGGTMKWVAPTAPDEKDYRAKNPIISSLLSL